MTNRLTMIGGVVAFLAIVVFLVIAFTGRISVAVTPTDSAHADGGAAASKGTSVASAIEQHISGWFIPDNQDTQAPNQTPTNQKFGAVASPDILSPYFSVGGARFWGYHQAISTASSTACGFLTPPGTTTIVQISATFNNTVGTALPIAIGWSTSVGATSTLIATANTPTNAALTLLATSTGMEQSFGGAAMEKKVLQPNTWINVQDGTSSAPGITGSCDMLLMDVSVGR